MLYQASVEILDRGDAPAQEILHKNAKSLAQRAADETKDELEKVMNRVEDIYQSFELVNALETNLASNLEYVDSIQELEEILSDTIKKNKYKQQVTIFIVGYQDVCQQKLTLLQQVNEFFMANSKSIDEEDWFPTTPDIDLEDVSNKIEDSLSTAEELTGRLGEINKEMVTYLTNYALNKGSHKAKKKVEKALQQAKDDINSLSEKLLAVQTEVEEKEEKIASLMKQGETRHMEIQRYKTAAEVAKKNMRDTEGLQEELTRRGALLDDANRRIESLQLELAQLSDTKAKSDMRLSTFSQDNVEKIEELQRLVQQKQLALDEAKRDLEKLHQMQILSLRDAHQAELEELQANHAEEIRRLLEEIASYKEQLDNMMVEDNEKEAAAPATDDQSVSSKTSSKDETRSTTKESQRSKSQVSVASKKSATTNVSKRSSRSSGKVDESSSKSYAEVSVQDEGGDPESATVSSHHLGVVRENTADFQDTFELTDEEAWATVPTEQVTGRFSQFRELTRRKLSELQEQVSSTMTKTHRKVETLKAQFKQHKSKWEAERNVLVAQINQAIKLQSEAEQEADSAMGQLENFIVEQEKLENLEDQRYLELSRATTKSAEQAQAELSALNTIPDQSDTLRSDVNSAARGENSATPIEITVHPDTTSAENLAQSRASEQSDGQVNGSRPRSSNSSRDGEPELTKLLQQTDDAKVQELRRSATTLSAAPTIETPAAERGQRRSQSAQVVLKSTFEDILQNLKKSLNDETSLEPQQAKALDAVRRALRISANEKELSDIQLDKTLAIVSLAAQVAEESIRLAVRPSCFFDLFGKMNVEALTHRLDFKVSTDNEIGKAGENLEDEVLKYSHEKTAPRQNEHKEAVLSTLLGVADPKSSPVPPTVVLSEADLEKVRLI